MYSPALVRAIVLSHCVKLPPLNLHNINQIWLFLAKDN